MKHFFNKIVSMDQAPSGAWYARVLCVREDGVEEGFFLKVGFGKQPDSRVVDQTILEALESKEVPWTFDTTGTPNIADPRKAKLGLMKRMGLFMAKCKDKLWRFIS